MKIAFTSSGNNMESNLDLRFGRAKKFIVVDLETNQWSVHNNEQNLNAVQGAGIQSADVIVKLGVDGVVTGNVGPKAFQVLSASRIKVFLCDEMPVSKALLKFRSGELKEISNANVQSHWS